MADGMSVLKDIFLQRSIITVGLWDLIQHLLASLGFSQLAHQHAFGCMTDWMWEAIKDFYRDKLLLNFWIDAVSSSQFKYLF
jgi:hypothetical protein